MRVFIITVLFTASLLFIGVSSSVEFAPMAESSYTAVCGSIGGDGEAGSKWGNMCDLRFRCSTCYGSNGKCNSCESEQAYLLCGSPEDVLCVNGSHIVDCGRLRQHQVWGEDENCRTCKGEGRRRSDRCNKNSCRPDLVEY